MADQGIRRDGYVIGAPAWVRIDFDEDGTPMYMGERLVELRPGYWVHPWNWELQLKQLEERGP
jgi:hypothetical protein